MLGVLADDVLHRAQMVDRPWMPLSRRTPAGGVNAGNVLAYALVGADILVTSGPADVQVTFSRTRIHLLES